MTIAPRCEPSSPAVVTSLSRRATMRAGLAVGTAQGLEIGPLADPVVAKSEGAVRYIDHTDTQTLRTAYAGNPDVDPGAIVEVDAIWGERTLAECIGGGEVDYVMASHVAEHVPDLITWLSEVRSVLRAGGQLRLALPDARFSHDVLRAETRLVDLLTARVLKARRPQVRDVLDFRLHVAPTADARTLYAGTVDRADIIPQHSVAAALEAAGWARDLPGHYFDVHCWVFSPRTFAGLMRQLAEHGLLGLACAEMVDTAPPIWEFYAFLTPCEDRNATVRSWADAYDRLRDPLPGSGAARAAEDAAAQQTLLRQGAESKEMAVRHASELARRLRQTEARLAALERSFSWRVTAPLRRVRALWGAARR